ncbi:MAG TPA: hypothetical protein VGA64_11310 [Candidatus Polarisedimenticolia bacterium]
MRGGRSWRSTSTPRSPAEPTIRGPGRGLAGGGSRHNIVCAKVIGYHCTNLSGGYCTSGAC